MQRSCSRRLGVIAFLAANMLGLAAFPSAGAAAAAPRPTIVVLQAPAASTTLRSATVRWRVSTAVTTRCTLDDLPARVCRSPFAATRLGIGRHTLRIVAGTSPSTADRTLAWRVTSPDDEATPVAGATSAVLTGPTTARLTTSLSPSSDAAIAYFEFGPTRTLGHVTPARPIASHARSRALSDSITELKPGSTYYYRVVVKGDSGSVRGATSSLLVPRAPSATTDAAIAPAAAAADPPVTPATTPIDPAPTPPGPVVTLVAPIVGATTVTTGAGGSVAHASIDPEALDTSYWVEYASTGTQTTSPATLAASSGPSTLAVVLPALSPGTYQVRYVARNEGGTTAGLTATLIVAAPLAPAVASGAAVQSGGGWSLQGTVDPRGSATVAWAEYGTSTSYGSSTATSSVGGAGTVTFPLGSLPAATTYHYRIVAQSAAGRTYGADAVFSTTPPAGTYVATTGNDANDGSFSSPWRTLQKAANTVAPGTTVYVRGGSYAGFTMTRSGSAGAPITFAGYSGETAEITAATGSSTIDINAAQHIVLRDLTVDGAVGQYNAGVMIRNAADDVTVTGCVLAHNHSYGVRAYNDTNITITDNLITANDTGVRIDFSGEGMVIADNRIVDNQGMVVNDPAPGNDSGANAIAFYKSTGHISVTGNTVHGNRAPSDDYGYDGGAFEIFGASNITIAENLVYDNQNVVETGTDANHTPCANNVFVHNVAYGGNDKSAVSALGPVANGLLLRCAQNMLVANNTLADLDFWTYDISQSSSYSGGIDGLRIVNNVNLQHHDKVYALEFALPTSVVIDANDDYNEGGGTLAYVAGHGNTSSLADLRAWAGADTHGVLADPRVIDEAGRDFRLAAGSPAIDLGSAIAGVTDGFRGSAPDSGRFESS